MLEAGTVDQPQPVAAARVPGVHVVMHAAALLYLKYYKWEEPVGYMVISAIVRVIRLALCYIPASLSNSVSVNNGKLDLKDIYIRT